MIYAVVERMEMTELITFTKGKAIKSFSCIDLRKNIQGYEFL